MEKRISKEDSEMVLAWLKKYSGARPFGEGWVRDCYEYSMDSYVAGDYYSTHDLKCVSIHHELVPLFEKAVKVESGFLGRYDHEGLCLNHPEKNEVLSQNYFDVCRLVEKYFILGYTLSAVYDEMHHALDHSGFRFGEKSWRFADQNPFNGGGALIGAAETLRMKMRGYGSHDYIIRIGECVTAKDLSEDLSFRACRYACAMVCRGASINSLSVQELLDLEHEENEKNQRASLERDSEKEKEHVRKMLERVEIAEVLSEEEANAEFEKRLIQYHQKVRKNLPALQKLIRKILIEISIEIKSYC